MEEINLKITHVPVVAQSRKLRTKWNVEISPIILQGVHTGIWWIYQTKKRKSYILRKLGLSEFKDKEFNDFSEDGQQKLTDFSVQERYHKYNTKTKKSRRMSIKEIADLQRSFF